MEKLEWTARKVTVVERELDQRRRELRDLCRLAYGAGHSKADILRMINHIRTHTWLDEALCLPTDGSDVTESDGGQDS